jgi:Uma2 family endonuclease
MTTTTTRLSLESFLRIPEQQPAVELNPDGSIQQKMSPTTDHAAIQAHLSRLLLNHLDQALGTGYVYTELRTNLHGASRLPDVAFYLRRPRANRRKHALVAADLSIEILSPSDDLDQQQDKCRWYLQEGASVVLLVDPEARTIHLFTNSAREPRTYAGDTSLAGLDELLPGLRLTPDRVFEILDR